MCSQEFLDEDVSEVVPTVDPVGVISEVLNNIGDPRVGIRELLSNAVAKEVGATDVELRVYESDKGLAFTVSDNGCGMDYTGDSCNPGRLDRFLNIAQGKQAGYISDEFGSKGLGTILLYNAEYVEVKTWDGGTHYYRVVFNEPYYSIVDQKRLCKPVLHRVEAKLDPLITKGTKVSVHGWDLRQTVSKTFRLDSLEQYLMYKSVIGYTRLDARGVPFPKFTLRVGGKTKVLSPGFNYIVQTPDEEKTVVFGPLQATKKTSRRKDIEVTLKGGVTVETSRFKLTDVTGGVWVSVEGIPYFKLRANKYARILNLTDDFVRFVAECDDIRLNMGRNDFNYDEHYEVFEESLRELFYEIKEDQRFQRFYARRHREKRIALQKFMTETKSEYLSPDKRFVWFRDRKLLGEPKSEQDVAAILWLLEGMNALPFETFRTLQYAGYRKGIDLLADLQENPESEMRLCVYGEVEKLFSSFLRHGHDPRQTSFVICWRIDGTRGRPGKLKKTDRSYKQVYTISDSSVPVYEVSKFPEVFVGTVEEAEDSGIKGTKERNVTQ